MCSVSRATSSKREEGSANHFLVVAQGFSWGFLDSGFVVRGAWHHFSYGHDVDMGEDSRAWAVMVMRGIVRDVLCA